MEKTNVCLDRRYFTEPDWINAPMSVVKCYLTCASSELNSWTDRFMKGERNEKYLYQGNMVHLTFIHLFTTQRQLRDAGTLGYNTQSMLYTEFIQQPVVPYRDEVSLSEMSQFSILFMHMSVLALSIWESQTVHFKSRLIFSHADHTHLGCMCVCLCAV